MSGQHWENYDTKREIVHYYPQNVTSHAKTYTNGCPFERLKRTAEKRMETDVQAV